ncbi:hypothetical protein AWB74_04555 [Caballeronia arvi]|uniref:Uncharacterized protein n=1 Tax=Caballeronia arvi TaxID=1777135 RepID=A0A158JY99_9BURK|nr:hypothetical protein AWB74_04555 [Caballeronia arvi]
MLTKGVCVDLFDAGDISDELLILRPLVSSTRNDDRLTHRRMTGDLCLDFPKLDTKAANLDLMIVPAKELDIAIGSISRDITRAVHTRISNERIIDEALGSEIRTIQITTRHTRSTDIQFTHRTGRHELILRIEQIHARVGDRTTDRYRGRHFRCNSRPIAR